MNAARVMQESWLLVKQLQQLLGECPVCMLPFTLSRKRVVVCMEQHPICCQCVQKISPKRCPMCRRTFKQNEVRFNRLYLQIVLSFMPKLTSTAQIFEQYHIYESEAQGLNDVVSRHRLGYKTYKKLDMGVFRSIQNHRSKIKNRAQMFVNTANIGKTIDCLKSQIQKSLKSDEKIQNFIGLGNIEQVDGIYQNKTALGTFNALKVSIIHASTYDLLSFCCIFSRQTIKHLHWYYNMIKQYPKNACLVFGKANLHYKTGNISQAVEGYKNAHLALPGCQKVTQALINATVEGCRPYYSSSLKNLFNQILSFSPHHKYAAIIAVHIDEYDTKQNLDLLLSMNSQWPEDIQVLLAIALYYFKRNDREGIEYVEKAESLNITHYQLVIFKAIVCIYKGKISQALKYEQFYTKSGKRRHRILRQILCNRFAMYYLKEADFFEAKQWFTEELLNHSSYQVLDIIELCQLIIKKDSEHTERKLCLALNFEKRYPNHCRVMLSLIAQCFMRLGRYQAAVIYITIHIWDQSSVSKLSVTTNLPPIGTRMEGRSHIV